MDIKVRKEVSEVFKDMDMINSLAIKGLLSHEEKDVLVQEFKNHIAQILSEANKPPQTPIKKEQKKAK